MAVALRLLFWLKWKLLLRNYQRSKSAAFGAILAILLFLPMSLGIAVLCGVLFFQLSPEPAENVLRAVLLGIYLVWLLSPLLGYALSDSYDITKLFLYPITSRQIFVGAILGSILDFPVLLLLPTLLAALIGFTHSPAAGIIVFLALGLFLFHTLSLTQALLLLTAGVLRSRRFRDLVVILIPLFWMGYYVVSRTLAQRAVHVDWRAFLHSPFWAAINLLPPGLTARSVAAASRGEWGLSAGLLAAVFAFAAATVYLAGWLIEKVFAGEVVSPTIRRTPAPAPAVAPAAARAVSAAAAAPAASSRSLVQLPPVVEAVMEKELRYIMRDPYFKIALMNLVYMLAVAIFAFSSNRRSGLGSFGSLAVWGATGLVLMSEMQLVFNLFGTEGGAAAILFLFPSSRRQILIGKDLTLFSVLSLVNLAFMAVLSGLAGQFALFGPLFCWMELALTIFVAVGNVTSILFPFRAAARGWRNRQQSAGRGCGYGFLYLGISALAFGVLLPVLAALALPTFLVAGGWFALTIPLALAYAAGIYLLSLRIAEPLLMQREIRIIDRVSQPVE